MKSCAIGLAGRKEKIMKYTKANIVKLLEAIEKNSLKLAGFADKKGDKTTYDRYLDRSVATREAIWLLTNKNYFDDLAKIFANDL